MGDISCLKELWAVTTAILAYLGGLRIILFLWDDSEKIWHYRGVWSKIELTYPMSFLL